MGRRVFLLSHSGSQTARDSTRVSTSSQYLEKGGPGSQGRIQACQQSISLPSHAIGLQSIDCPSQTKGSRKAQSLLALPLPSNNSPKKSFDRQRGTIVKVQGRSQHGRRVVILESHHLMWAHDARGVVEEERQVDSHFWTYDQPEMIGPGRGLI